jgi:hypothetical protein
MSFWGKIRPARQEAPEDTRVVVDLDKMAAESIGFRYKGRIHQIKPMSTERFLNCCNELAALDKLWKSTKVDHKQLADRYAGLFSAVCGTITKTDVYEMTLAQRGALMQQVLEIVQGKAFSSEKKSPVKE